MGYYFIATLLFIEESASIFTIDLSNFIKDVRLLYKRCTTLEQKMYDTYTKDVRLLNNSRTFLHIFVRIKLFFILTKPIYYACSIQNDTKTKQFGIST